MSSRVVIGTPPPPSGTASATRVGDVLLLFLEHPEGLGVSLVSRRLGLSKAVVHRILQSLEARGLTEFDPASRRYRLGPAISALGAQALRDADLRRAALPVLRRLHAETGETTTVSALIGAARVYVDQIESLREVKMTVELGRAFPLHAGASSRAILAFAPAELRDRVLADDLVALTPDTLTDQRRLEADLQEIRRARVATSSGQRQHGAGSVAAPVFGADGQVVGSISVCGPIDRFDAQQTERLRPLVREAAAEISASLHAPADRPEGAR